jgi:nucleotide-binding universal stress UspA family protein
MKPILVGIDFSASSSSVLRHAAHAARLSGLPVHAVHVLDAGRVAHWVSGGGKMSEAALREQALERLKGLVAAQAPDAAVTTEVRTGRPAAELCRAVEERGASLLVIAANDLTKKRLGSVASACVRSAACDVLVLRDWQEGNFRRVVVCADFSPLSARALERGVELATAHGARLETVHVLYPPDRDVWGEVMEHAADSPVPYAEECRERARREAAAFLAPQAAALAGIEHHLVILESAFPSVALTGYLQDTGADLAVLGTKGHSRIGGMVLGTNAERLLHDVAVSVLAVRPTGEEPSAP